MSAVTFTMQSALYVPVAGKVKLFVAGSSEKWHR